MNILFTSAGRRVELLRAFRAAYGKLDLKGSILAIDVDPLAPSLQVADRSYLVPPLRSPEYVPTLIDVCRRHEVNVIFPLIDPDISVLADARVELEETGARVAVVAKQAAEMISDKWLTVQLFRSAGLATPLSWLPEHLRETKVTYPLFIKPRRGSAGKLAFKVNNERELKFFCDYVPDPIIQEYLPGDEITNDVVVDLDANVLGVVSRRRIEVRSGEVAKGVTVYNPVVTQACVTLTHRLPAIGPITVQCILKDGVPCFTEINARMGGGFPLGIVAGADSPQWLLGKLAGLPVEIPPLGSYQVGLHLTRFDDSFFVTEAQYEQMEGNRLRPGRRAVSGTKLRP